MEPLVIHIFSPLSTYLPPFFTAAGQASSRVGAELRLRQAEAAITVPCCNCGSHFSFLRVAP